MSLLFQNPALFGLLALAGLPLLVHLLSRTRPPEYRFSNLEFLRRVLRTTARFRKPKDRLLLILRTLALAALALAFIAPFLISKNATLPGEKSTIILLIDRSASMLAREGAGSRFDAASSEAVRILESTKPSAANLVWIDAHPSAAFPEPGSNLSFLGDLLKTSEPRPEPGAMAAAFDLALRQLARADGRRELVVISDFQATAWRDFQPTLPPDLKITTHRVATGAAPNLAVTRLLAQPAAPVVGQEITLLASVRNYSPNPVRTRLTLDADGALQSQPLDLAPWGEAEAAFTLKPARPGSMPASATIEADAFPGDDSRHTIIHVREALRLAISHTDTPVGTVVARLASALPWLEAVGPAQSPDITLIPPSTPVEEILALAKAGTIPWIHDPQPPSATLIPGQASPPARETSPTGWQILPDESHPAVQLFRSGDFGNPFAGSFRERLELPADLSGHKDIRTVASYSDGVPAIFTIATEDAPILFFNLPLDPEKSDWPTHGVFLPAIAEILLRTDHRNKLPTRSHAQPGDPLHFTSSAPEQSGALTLLGPDGKTRPLIESTTAEGTQWRTDTPATPGIFRWQISGQTIAHIAVNFPESESDLRPLETDPTLGGRSLAGDSLARRAALAGGLPLWPWLALAALGLLTAESLIHLRASRPSSV